MKIHGDPPTEEEWRAAGVAPVDINAIEHAFDDVLAAAERARSLHAWGTRTPVELEDGVDIVSDGTLHRIVRTVGCATEYTLREIAVITAGAPLDRVKLRVAVRAALQKLDQCVQCDPGGDVPVGPVVILPPQWTARCDDEGRPQGQVRVRFTVLGRIALHPGHPELITTGPR